MPLQDAINSLYPGTGNPSLGIDLSPLNPFAKGNILGAAHDVKPGAAFLTVTATMFGGPTDPGTRGSSGACADNNTHGGMTFAELGGGKGGGALGNLPCGTPIRITYKGRTVTAYKTDTNEGAKTFAKPVSGAGVAVDLWYKTAAALNFSGSGTVVISQPNGKPFPKGAVGTPGTATDKGSTTDSQRGTDVLSPLKEFAKAVGFVFSASGADRIIKVVGGGTLLLLAANELVKGAK